MQLFDQIFDRIALAAVAAYALALAAQSIQNIGLV